MIVLEVEIGVVVVVVEGRRSLAEGLLILGESIGGRVAGGVRWAFGRDKPWDGSLLRGERQHLGRRCVVAVEVEASGEAVEMDSFDEAAVVD
jgi:hypothetical protein